MDWWDTIGAFFGLNGSGVGYNFWSGFGSDLSEFAILGGAVAVYRKHTCHIDGCWRISKHKHTQDGQEYMLCRKHHPAITGPITADQMTTNKEK